MSSCSLKSLCKNTQNIHCQKHVGVLTLVKNNSSILLLCFKNLFKSAFTKIKFQVTPCLIYRNIKAFNKKFGFTVLFIVHTNSTIFTIENIYGMLKSTYKECARDKLVDHTATCNSKVLMLERWGTFKHSYRKLILRSVSNENNRKLIQRR